MSRAAKFLTIYEGFKLGSLGAGKVKFTNNPEKPQKPEEEFRLHIWNIDQDKRKETLTWTQYFTPKLLSELKVNPDERDISDLTVKLGSLYQSKDPQGKTIIGEIPILTFSQIYRKDGAIGRKAVYMSKALSFSSMADFLTWMNKHKPRIERLGIEAIQDFSKNWKRISIQ